jgi:hypothetical protein
MNEQKHTPGPWHVEEDSGVERGAIQHSLFAGAVYLGDLCEAADDPALQHRGWLPIAESRANALLIAAAPDLLQAALYFVSPDFRAQEGFDRLKAAIVKAIGEEAYSRLRTIKPREESRG